jgi:hypothetical protein
MKLRTFLSVILALGLMLTGPVLMAQEETEASAPAVPDSDAEEQAPPLIEEEILAYDDYTVKGYSITVFGGNFSGAKYLENMDLPERTILEQGAGDILGFLTEDPSNYDGPILRVSQNADQYTGAHKEIKSGPAYGARIGIYISKDFHMDLSGTYATGEAVTTMRFTPDPVNEPDKSSRVQVDSDEGFKMFKGGLALMYDATPAKFFGIVPRLGFGLGGIINRYSELSDVTGLYLEGNLGLNFKVMNNFQFGGQVDLTNFAYEVEELGYSNVVNYATYSLGLTVFLDVIPPEVKASHLAGQNN